jgi:predicted anti-sigma-YlaC factor YlaD
MDCSFVKNNMINYLENVLEKDSRQSFEKHLKGCANCMQVFDGFNKTYSLLGKEMPIAADPLFYSNLSARINTKQVGVLTKQNVFNMLRAVAAVLLVAVCVASGVLLGSQFTSNASGAVGYQDESETYSEYVYLNDMDDEIVENYFLIQKDE